MNTFTTWCALSAALMFIEFDQSGNTFDDIRLFIHHNDGGSSETSFHPNQVIKVHKDGTAYTENGNL
jgi:hypothetical protein